MKTIEYEGKKLFFDFGLGTINDVYVKEFGGNFDDLLNIEQFQTDTSKIIEITRDMLLSGHIYYLFVNGEDEKAEEFLSKKKSSRMIATKWVEKMGLINALNFIGESMQPSEVEQPQVSNNSKKKKL